MDPVSVFSNLWCGSMVGIATGLVGYYLTKRIINVRRNAVLHGRTPPSIISLIPQEFCEMIKVMFRVLSYLLGMMTNCFHAIGRRLRPPPIPRRFWPGRRPRSQQERLPTPTPYLQDAGMRSGSTRDFRPVLPSNNQHLIESGQPSFEAPRAAPAPPSHEEATTRKQQSSIA